MVLDPEQLKTAAEIAEIGSGLMVGAGFLPTVVGCAKKWVSAKFHGHPQKAIDAALSNFNGFSGQVNICLGGMQQIEGFEEKKEQALADPDYTSLFQEAALGAARINSEQKHKLLARLVTDRLVAEPESLRILAAHLACNAVPQLSPKHLQFLGVMAVFYEMKVPEGIRDTSDEETFKNGLGWLSKELQPLMPFETLGTLDYTHLAAVSCITFGHNLDISILKRRFSTRSYSRAWIEQSEFGQELIRAWKEGLHTAILTPAGALIGMYVQETIPTERLKWNF